MICSSHDFMNYQGKSILAEDIDMTDDPIMNLEGPFPHGSCSFSFLNGPSR